MKGSALPVSGPNPSRYGPVAVGGGLGKRRQGGGDKRIRDKKNWLPDMDSNHDKQIQSLLCYRYTIGQPRLLERLRVCAAESRGQPARLP
jgi:hypothetical protein